jgi:hypothetical protein
VRLGLPGEADRLGILRLCTARMPLRAASADDDSAAAAGALKQQCAAVSPGDDEGSGGGNSDRGGGITESGGSGGAGGGAGGGGEHDAVLRELARDGVTGGMTCADVEVGGSCALRLFTVRIPSSDLAYHCALLVVGTVLAETQVSRHEHAGAPLECIVRRLPRTKTH